MRPIQFPLFLIPLLPLLGAAISLIFGRRMRRQSVHLVAVGAVVAACVVALVAIFGHLLGDVSLLSLRSDWIKFTEPGAPRLVNTAYTWIAAGDVKITAGFMLDPLSAVMVLVVTFVGSLIHIYSCGYMGQDPDYARYFGYLNLFTGSMLILVLADNLVLTFVGWEGVGLCSYLLIGFWYEKSANATAGKKAFVVNRIGDFGFLLGMLLLWATVGTLNYAELQALADSPAALLDKRWHFFFEGYDFATGQARYLITLNPAEIIGICLFVGAAGKSAQLPLYIWLPDAMAGPTPVSALIHAATMVTAGVYMVARLNYIYLLSPPVMLIIALVGAATALFAASIAFAQNDIKKVLAYSTVSQLGFMFAAVGVGAFGAGIFHLATHAFFKACLFMCAGAVIHALHEEQDIREMGGLRKKLPVVHWTFLVSCVAIAGIPFFSGFFSKDMIILGSAVNTIGKVNGDVVTWNAAAMAVITYIIYGLLTVASLFTAFYMFRLYALTFLGENRTDAKVIATLHTPSNSMRWPLIILAGGATVLGVFGLPPVLQGKYGGGMFLGGTVLAAAFLLWLGYMFANQVDPAHGESDPPSTWGIVQIPLTVIAAVYVFLGAWAWKPILLGKLLPAEYINTWLSQSIPALNSIGVKATYAHHITVHPYIVPSHKSEWVFMGIATVLAFVGVGTALALYRRGPSPAIGSLVARMGWFYRLVLDKWRIDELYGLLIVRPITWFAWFLRKGIDEFLVDKVLVTGISYVVYGIGWVAAQLQTGRVRQYLAAVLVGLGVLTFLVTRPQTQFRATVMGNQVTVFPGNPGDKIIGVAKGKFMTRIGFDFDNDGKVDKWLSTPTSGAGYVYQKPGKHKIRMVVEDPRFGTRSSSTRVVTIKEGR